MSNATRIGTEPSKAARWVVLIIVGLVFAIPIISMIEFTFRVGPAGGYTFDHWTALFDPANARNYRDLAQANKRGYALFALALLRRGVRVLERGAWFVSAAHDDAIVDQTLAIVTEAALEVAAQLEG